MRGFLRSIAKIPSLLFPVLFFLAPLGAQPRAILADGAGPWRDSQWSFTVAQFSALLTDAGYSVTVVSPADLASALSSSTSLLAVPSLESLPVDVCNAIAPFVNAGGTLMASGGQPFRDPLYLTPGGQWLDYAAYSSSVGSAPSQGIFTIPTLVTLSPAKEQYTDSSGLRFPVPRGRGIFAGGINSRYRVIGDLLAPAATIFVNNGFNFNNNGTSEIIWLPWPQLVDPLRAQLVSALAAAPAKLYLLNAGGNQVVFLPGEDVLATAFILNANAAPLQATLQWSLSGPSGTTALTSVPVSPFANNLTGVSLDLGHLALGEYVLTVHLLAGTQEVDRIDSPVRVLDPVASRQPDQKIQVLNGGFAAGGRHIFLNGVNFWPRYIAGLEANQFQLSSWLDSDLYDPDIVEADLTEVAALGFNLVSIQYDGLWGAQGRAMVDFLERCRAHGLWARIAIGTTDQNNAFTGTIAPDLDTSLQAAYLAGNDRVFAYDILWEPMVGPYSQGQNGGRVQIDPDWRSWVNAQYGSLANAQQAWSFTAPLDGAGQLTSPSDDQFANDGPWRIMTAAYRRFLEDYLGRNIGAIARAIRRNDPDTLLTYRDWTTMTAVHNAGTAYDIGTGAAHLDFVSPERYAPVLLWPDDRAYGLITAYSRFRTAGKPVQWAEFGADVGGGGATTASLAAQSAICDTMMRQIVDDGSNGGAVWWWPGGNSPADGTDFGIVTAAGSPRPCALTLAQWNAKFAAAAPDLTADPPTTITVDRDADARGSYGLFLNFQDRYVQARQAGMSVMLADAGTGTDTSTMPLIQVGDPPYTGTGPLKFANAEVASIHVVCPTLDVTGENRFGAAVPAGAVCQITPTLVNTGEAKWLAASAASGGVTLHTSAGDIPLAAALPSLQRTAMGPLTITMPASGMIVTGRMQIAGVGPFGEAFTLQLTPDATVAGSCATTLSSTGPILAPAAGVTGTIQVSLAAGCNWSTYIPPQQWLTVTPDTGSGNGTVTYTIAVNLGSVRQTTLFVAGHTFTVIQAANAIVPLTAAPLLSTTALTFANQNLASSSVPQSVRLTNNGSAALQLSSLTIGGPNSRDFVVGDNCGASVAAAATCTLQVTFSPTGVGSRTATLFVNGNVGGAVPAVSLAGVGAATGPTPTIQAIADSWGYTSGIAPGLWVTIGGANLGGLPQTWNLDGVQLLPTTLGGVTVTFNNAPAALLYVSANQINALVPASVVPGTVNVVVQSNGVSSSPFTMTAVAAHPAVYALPTPDGSTFYVTAVLPGTATLLGNSAVDSRVARAVFPGETIDLYMIGLGATLDPTQFITNQIFAGAYPVSASVTATVGGESASVLFAGLTTPGLYLVRIVVPSDLKPGAQPLQVSVGGALTRPALVLQIAALPPA